jgi:hypothetical protein
MPKGIAHADRPGGDRSGEPTLSPSCPAGRAPTSGVEHANALGRPLTSFRFSEGGPPGWEGAGPSAGCLGRSGEDQGARLRDLKELTHDDR